MDDKGERRLDRIVQCYLFAGVLIVLACLVYMIARHPLEGVVALILTAPLGYVMWKSG